MLGETTEQRPSPPPSPFNQTPISTGSGIPVLGAPTKVSSHQSDVTVKQLIEKCPPGRTESTQDHKQDHKREHLKQDRNNRDRTFDRKRNREREMEKIQEREMDHPRSHRSPHHNQPSSHPTGPPGDRNHNARDVQRMGYHL